MPAVPAAPLGSRRARPDAACTRGAGLWSRGAAAAPDRCPGVARPAPWVPKGKAWLGLRALPGQACPLCVAVDCPVQPPPFPRVPCTATLLLPWEPHHSIVLSCSGHPWVPVRRRLLLAPEHLPLSCAPSCKGTEPWTRPGQLPTCSRHLPRAMPWPGGGTGGAVGQGGSLGVSHVGGQWVTCVLS